MSRRNYSFIACASVVLLAFGCRVEPGETDYASQQIDDFVDDTDTGDSTIFLPGPDPYVQGEARLAFGPFYEGSASEEIPVNDVTNFLFVFETGGRSTLEIVSSTDRIEGFESNVLRLTGTPFWGTSIAFLDDSPDDGGMPRPEDLSAFDTMHISFKSADASFDDIDIAIGSLGGEASVPASNYGWVNDGEWQTLDIPLADFADASLTTVTTPLIVSRAGGSEGDELLVDNFYYTAAQ